MKHLLAFLICSLTLITAQEGEYGFRGYLETNSQTKGRIGADLEDGYTYHTYSFTVPEGIGTVNITLESLDADLDLAVHRGSSIPNYNGADFFDNADSKVHTYTLTNAVPESVYNVEVINQTKEVSSYLLSLEASQSTQGNTAPALLKSKKIGVLTPELQVQGFITESEDPEFSLYHTYIVDVPENSQELTIELTSTQGIDIAIKYGNDLSSYQSQDDGGDWLQADFNRNPSSTLTVTNPEPGFWYIDVIHSDTGNRRYTIKTSLQ